MKFNVNLQLIRERLTLTKFTTAYFLFSLAHCIVQVALQADAFSINAHAATFIWDLASPRKIFNHFVIPELHQDFLRLCPAVILNDQSRERDCLVVWNATSPNQHITTGSPFPGSVSSAENPESTSIKIANASATGSISAPAPVATGEVEEDDEDDDESDDGSDSDSDSDSDDEDEDEDEGEDEFEEEKPKVATSAPIRRSSDSPNTEDVLLASSELSDECRESLYFPGFVLDNTKREDIVFIAFNVWVLGMSVVAILHESIPHIIASCATHVMATAWSSFQIVHTSNFKANFHRAVVNGACEGTQIIPDYWNARAKAELPTLVLNIVALFVSVFLTWRLMKTFGWQTFKKLGASRNINRLYQIMLALSISLQISFFFMIVTVCLWIENLFNGPAADVAEFKELYRASAFILVALLVPWLLAGWFGARTERRNMMLIFLIFCLLYLIAWATMFYSHTFRWTFLNWRFYTIMASVSVVLTIITFVLGVFCRYNFGKGLLDHLHTKKFADDSSVSQYTVFDEEKIEFPQRRSERFLRTFSKIMPARSQPAPPPVPSMPRPVLPLPVDEAFFGQGRSQETDRHPDMPLARPGFKELVLRSDTASTQTTGHTDPIWHRCSS